MGYLRSTMGISARTALALYLLLMFATLPFLPEAVSYLTSHLGREAVFLSLHVALAAAGLLPAARLFLPPRPAPPWPHLAYILLALLALVLALTLASSPIGRIHLAEYGLLGILVLRSLRGRRAAGRYAQALLLTVAVGIVDEIVQHFLPNRFFDWYDIGLNSGAAALGTAAAAWWDWTGEKWQEGCGVAPAH